jgi:branched-chain amino acid transport system ATP-binding protein
MAVLEVDAVTVRFAGVVALEAASLAVEPGRVTGLIGPNGAGKTTLFNVITGLQAPSAGHVVLDGRDITRAKPHKRARRGIARTFQRLEAFGSLTARDNVLVALEMRRRWSPERYAPGPLADALLEQIGIAEIADVKVELLPTGSARLVEVARALAVAPKVLLLDEPSSGLDNSETRTLGSLLMRLAADGLGILLVEHDMGFVMDTCAHIDVLDFGRVIARGSPAEVQANAAVQQAYLGTKAART